MHSSLVDKSRDNHSSLNQIVRDYAVVDIHVAVECPGVILDRVLQKGKDRKTDGLKLNMITANILAWNQNAVSHPDIMERLHPFFQNWQSLKIVHEIDSTNLPCPVI